MFSRISTVSSVVAPVRQSLAQVIHKNPDAYFAPRQGNHCSIRYEFFNNNQTNSGFYTRTFECWSWEGRRENIYFVFGIRENAQPASRSSWREETNLGTFWFMLVICWKHLCAFLRLGCYLSRPCRKLLGLFFFFDLYLGRHGKNSNCRRLSKMK